MENLTFEKDFETYGDDKIITIVPISIGEYKFDIYISDKEADKTYNQYSELCEHQYNTIDAVIALKKLTNFLNASIDINISNADNVVIE